MFPVRTLQNIVQKAVTVFFLPITEILISMVECEPDSETGELILGLYPEIKCFSGYHLLHGSLALIITLIFVFIALVCSYTLFENQMLTGDPKHVVIRKVKFGLLYAKLLSSCHFHSFQQVWIGFCVQFLFQRELECGISTFTISHSIMKT